MFGAQVIKPRCRKCKQYKSLLQELQLLILVILMHSKFRYYLSHFLFADTVTTVIYLSYCLNYINKLSLFIDIFESVSLYHKCSKGFCSQYHVI